MNQEPAQTQRGTTALNQPCLNQLCTISKKENVLPFLHFSPNLWLYRKPFQDALLRKKTPVLAQHTDLPKHQDLF